MTTETTATEIKLPARQSAKDDQGRTYVRVQHLAGAAVTAHDFTVRADGKAWTSAVYDVTVIDGQPPALRVITDAITFDGRAWSVGGQRAKNLTAAVRIAIGQPAEGDIVTAPEAAPAISQAKPPTTRKPRKSADTRKAEKTAADQASGSSVIEADPETGLPRIKPEVQAKADAIVAAQLAKNAG
jgi:hypothetical protein